MSISAIYRAGVFQPLEPVALPEESVVRLEVLATEEAPHHPGQSFFEVLGTRDFSKPSDDFKDLPEDFRGYTP